MSTCEVAEQIAKQLSDRLADVTRATLPSVRSVFLTGSFVRGDWFDRNITEYSETVTPSVLRYTADLLHIRAPQIFLYRNNLSPRSVIQISQG